MMAPQMINEDGMSHADHQRMMQQLQANMMIKDQQSNGSSKPTSREKNNRKVVGPSSIRTLIKSAATRD